MRIIIERAGSSETYEVDTETWIRALVIARVATRVQTELYPSTLNIEARDLMARLAQEAGLCEVSR